MTTTAPHDAALDYALTDAIIDAWRRAALATDTALAPVAGPRGKRLEGVYDSGRGLYARFCRHVNGKRQYFLVQTGTMGDYSKQEEQRLHALWLEATDAWDAEHGRDEL